MSARAGMFGDFGAMCEGVGADSYYYFYLQLFLCGARPVLAARAGGYFAAARGGGGAACRRIARGAGLRRGGRGVSAYRRHIGGISAARLGHISGRLVAGAAWARSRLVCAGFYSLCRGYFVAVLGVCFKFCGCGGA